MEKRLRDVYSYEGRTVVIDNAISSFPDASTEPSELPAPIAPHRDKFRLFYLTRYYPHKGLEMLVEVMDKYRESLANVVIVITIEASQGKGAAKLLNEIASKGLENLVVNVGPLRKEQLPEYYAACDALIMPTRLESFSSAHLEAMHFELPILTSDLDFAREVCGDAALYFDPWDPGAIRDCILKLASDEQLASQLVAKGKERLNSYDATWESNARNVLEALEGISARG